MVTMTATWLLLVVFLGVVSAAGNNNGRPPSPPSFSQRIVVAVNAGGEQHTDMYGVTYAKDPTNDGVPSDYGKRFDIQRVHMEDQIIYQTERYSLSNNFGYDLPLKGDGNYVLVLKFCEVYFRAPYQKVFNVKLNNQAILSHVDIFQQVGLATAYDELIPFTVKNKGGSLVVFDQESKIKGGKIPLRFVKGDADNPKINAFYLLKGTVAEVPKLPPLAPRRIQEEDVLFEDEEDDEGVEFDPSDLGNEEGHAQTFTTGTSKKIRSGRVSIDPWELNTLSETYASVVIAAASGLVALVLVRSLV